MLLQALTQKWSLRMHETPAFHELLVCGVLKKEREALVASPRAKAMGYSNEAC